MRSVSSTICASVKCSSSAACMRGVIRFGVSQATLA
jgi:hypothetical protein